jgi:hypothetical protein
VFGRRTRKRVKLDRSWIGSVTTIERAFPMERTSAPQPSATAQPTASQSGCAWRHSSSDWQKRWGARRSRDGVRGRDGPLSSFLGASRVAIRPISRSSFNLESAFSCLAGASGMCSCKPRKLYGSQSWQIIARGDRRWLTRVYLGRDHETNKVNITIEPFRVPCGNGGPT